MASALDSLGAFQSWSSEDRQLLASRGRERALSAGQVLFEEGARGVSLFIVLKGRIQIQKRVKDQKTVLAILPPGEVFGEMALYENLPRSAAARSSTEASVLELTGQQLEALEKDAPNVAMLFKEVILRGLTHRMREFSREMEVLQFWMT